MLEIGPVALGNAELYSELAQAVDRNLGSSVRDLASEVEQSRKAGIPLARIKVDGDQQLAERLAIEVTDSALDVLRIAIVLLGFRPFEVGLAIQGALEKGRRTTYAFSADPSSGYVRYPAVGRLHELGLDQSQLQWLTSEESQLLPLIDYYSVNASGFQRVITETARSFGAAMSASGRRTASPCW